MYLTMLNFRKFAVVKAVKRRQIPGYPAHAAYIVTSALGTGIFLDYAV
jgi:hypothetical protein